MTAIPIDLHGKHLAMWQKFCNVAFMLRRQVSEHVLEVGNRFRADDPQYSAGIAVLLLVTPSNDTRVLTAAALAGLRVLYRPGFAYKIAGVMLPGLADTTLPQQGTLFDTAAPTHATQGMGTLDDLNQRFGRGTLRLASQGITPQWQERAERLSPCYTTRWTEVPVVRAD